MWILLSVPILILFCGGAIAFYGIITSVAKGLEILVIGFFIIIYLIIAIVLLWLLSIPYRNCKTKGAKVFYCLCVTVCFCILLNVFFSTKEFTDISFVNESKNEIITDVKMISLEDKYLAKEVKIFKPSLKAYKIRGTEEMTNRCKTLGMKYEKGYEWFHFSKRDEELVGGLWSSESCSSSISKGIWIIAIETYNISTGESYLVVYTQNAFTTYVGEQFSFSYSGENISLIERKEPEFIPKFIDNHRKKEVPMRFEPNIIVITQNQKYGTSSFLIHDSVYTFPVIHVGKYDFYSIEPNKTYTATFNILKWNDNKYDQILKENKEFTIENNNIVFYFDVDRKFIKELQPITNYAKFKL